jgi:hypothetical protein
MAGCPIIFPFSEIGLCCKKGSYSRHVHSQMSCSIDFYSKLQNEELNSNNKDLYCSPINVGVIKSRRMRWAGHVARMGQRRGVSRVLVGIPEGNRPLERPNRRWEDNIRMDLKEVGCGSID